MSGSGGYLTAFQELYKHATTALNVIHKNSILIAIVGERVTVGSWILYSWILTYFPLYNVFCSPLQQVFAQDYWPLFNNLSTFTLKSFLYPTRIFSICGKQWFKHLFCSKTPLKKYLFNVKKKIDCQAQHISQQILSQAYGSISLSKNFCYLCQLQQTLASNCWLNCQPCGQRFPSGTHDG